MIREETLDTVELEIEDCNGLPRKTGRALIAAIRELKAFAREVASTCGSTEIINCNLCGSKPCDPSCIAMRARELGK